MSISPNFLLEADDHPIRLRTERGRRTPRVVAYLTMTLFALLLNGCLSRPALVRQTFALQGPLATNASARTGDGVLLVASCNVSPLFSGRSLVYRTGENSYEQDPSAGFLIPPAEDFGIAVRQYLRSGAAFRDVVEPGGILPPDRLAEVQVTELYGDFRATDRPTAVLTIRFKFIRAGGEGKPPMVFLEKLATRSVPLREKTAVGVVAAWNQGLAEIMNEVAAGLSARP